MNIAFQPTQCYQEMRYGTWLFWAKWRVDYGLGSDSANQSVWRVSLGLVLRPLLLCTVLCYVVLLVVSFCPLPATSSLQSRADWPVPYPAHDQSSSAQPIGRPLKKPRSLTGRRELPDPVPVFCLMSWLCAVFDFVSFVCVCSPLFCLYNSISFVLVYTRCSFSFGPLAGNKGTGKLPMGLHLPSCR